MEQHSHGIRSSELMDTIFILDDLPQILVTFSMEIPHQIPGLSPLNLLKTNLTTSKSFLTIFGEVQVMIVGKVG